MQPVFKSRPLMTTTLSFTKIISFLFALFIVQKSFIASLFCRSHLMSQIRSDLLQICQKCLLTRSNIHQTCSTPCTAPPGCWGFDHLIRSEAGVSPPPSSQSLHAGTNILKIHIETVMSNINYICAFVQSKRVWKSSGRLFFRYFPPQWCSAHLCRCVFLT